MLPAPCCLNSTAEQEPEEEKANRVGKISAPLKSLAKIPPTSIAFYSMAACPCVRPQTPFNGTVLISCVTTTKGRMRPSPFLSWRSTCTLSSRQHLLTSGLVGQVVQEEYCIIKKVFLSQCGMTGIESFPSLFPLSRSSPFYRILGHTYAAFTECSHIQPHWLLFRCMARDTGGRVWWTVFIITSLIFIHSKITQ